jgi:hypothetical protein
MRLGWMICSVVISAPLGADGSAGALAGVSAGEPLLHPSAPELSTRLAGAEMSRSEAGDPGADVRSGGNALHVPARPVPAGADRSQPLSSLAVSSHALALTSL